MSYRLTCETRKNYLFCHVEGEDSLETSRAYWREIAGKCDELGLSKVLVEEELEGQLTDQEMFQMCSELPEIGLLGKQIAFVDLRLNHDEGNLFGETVAVHRGINAMIFNKVKEAERWLAAG